MKRKHKNNFFKRMNKKQRILFIILIIILLIVLGLVTHKIYTKYIHKDNNKNTITETKPKDKLENYNYYLSNNATEYEEKIFSELKEILSKETIAEEDYISSLSKLFISDLFTLNTKNSSSDVTSSQYIYTDYQKMYIEKVKNTLYSNIEINFDGTRNQKLPVVTNVEVTNIEKTNFSIKEESKDAYHITVDISYEQNLKYPVKYQLIMVKNNEVFQIVKMGEEI